MYAVEKAKIEARRKGHTVTETALQDGSTRLRSPPPDTVLPSPHQQNSVTMPRRRIVRPGSPSAPPPNAQRVQRVRDKLDRERESLDRWMSRLRRAVKAVRKHQKQAARLERRIGNLETP